MSKPHLQVLKEKSFEKSFEKNLTDSKIYDILNTKDEGKENPTNQKGKRYEETVSGCHQECSGWIWLCG